MPRPLRRITGRRVGVRPTSDASQVCNYGLPPPLPCQHDHPPTDAAVRLWYAAGHVSARSSTRPGRCSTRAGCATPRSRTSPARSGSTGRSSTGTSPARRSCSRSPWSATSTTWRRGSAPSSTRLGPRKRVKALTEAFVDFGLEYPAFVDCAQTLMRRPGPELLEEICEGALFRLGRGIAVCLRHVTDALEAGVASGDFKIADVHLLANTLYASGLGALQLARVGMLVKEAAPGVPVVGTALPRPGQGLPRRQRARPHQPRLTSRRTHANHE